MVASANHLQVRSALRLDFTDTHTALVETTPRRLLLNCRAISLSFFVTRFMNQPEVSRSQISRLFRSYSKPDCTSKYLTILFLHPRAKMWAIKFLPLMAMFHWTVGKTDPAPGTSPASTLGMFVADNSFSLCHPLLGEYKIRQQMF